MQHADTSVVSVDIEFLTVTQQMMLMQLDRHQGTKQPQSKAP